MATVETYRTYVQEVLQGYAAPQTEDRDVEMQAIFDTTRDHYQVVQAGWRNQHRVYGCIMHVDIKNNKIWIQHDGTEAGIANELVSRGVPKEDIVLAFHSPYKRQFTEFGVS